MASRHTDLQSVAGTRPKLAVPERAGQPLADWAQRLVVGWVQAQQQPAALRAQVAP
jgi:hypothetical protein